jgi:MFS family permease
MTPRRRRYSARALLPAVLWRNAAIRTMFLADLTSALGSAISTLAYPLLVLSRGGTPVQAGSVATISLATRLISRLPAGALVDRWPPRAVLVSADLVRALVTGLVPVLWLLDGLSFGLLAAVAVVEGLATALFGPAFTVLTQNLAAHDSDDLTDAIGLDQSVQAGSNLVGPALGGVLFALNPMLPFAIDAATYLASATLLLRIAGRRPPADAIESQAGLLAGVRWLLSERVLLSVLLYACGINLVAAAMDMLVVITLRSRGEPSATIGLVLSCAGVGALFGSVLAPFFVKRLSPPVILLGIGVSWSLILTLFTAHYRVWLVAGSLPVFMALAPAAGVVVGTALLSQAPPRLLGRISAATSIILTGLAAVGPILAGGLYQWLGTAGGWGLLAAATGALTVAGWIPMRRAGSLRVPKATASEHRRSGSDEERSERGAESPPVRALADQDAADRTLEVVAHQDPDAAS